MKMIAAQDRKGGIGVKGGLLVSLPSDMKYFRKVTSGHTVIMGRRTLESFPGGRPLPKRRNIVLSTTLPADSTAGYEVCRTPEELKKLLSADEMRETFVIGGGQIYELLLPLVEEAYITEIDAELGADTFIPVFRELSGWTCVSAGEQITENGLNYVFKIYRRND